MPLTAFENYVKGLMSPAPAAQQRLLESAMMQAPRNGRILTSLWFVYSELDQHDKALSVAGAVPPEAGEYRRARWYVALSLITLRRFDGALKELTSLHAQTGSAAISNALGITELRRAAVPGSAQKAAFYFERAVNEAPGDPDFHFNLGYAKALAGDTAGATLWLRETIRRSAADGDARLVLAAVLASAGRAAESQRELELARLLGTSVEGTPSAAKVPPGLERVRDRLDAASPSGSTPVTPLGKDQPDTARFHLTRARTLFQETHDREAIAEVQRAIYLAPNEDEPHVLLGDAYRRAGRYAEAIDELKVAAWAKETAATRIALGRAYFESGDNIGARAEFERALSLAPDSAEAREWLRKIGGLMAPRSETPAAPPRNRVLTSSGVSWPIPVSARSN
jgi:Flp pilus assembly protein TadD